MPIFEYVCNDCQESFEQLVNREESVKCPSCEGEHLEKQFSRFGVSNGTSSTYPSLPQYKAGGSCCNPGSCGCKN